MSWTQVILLLLELLGPILAELLKRLLERSADALNPIGEGADLTHKQLEELWLGVLRRTPAWNLIKRRLVRVAAKLSLDRLDEINRCRVVGSGSLPPLSGSELTRLAGAIDGVYTVGQSDTADILG